MSSFRMIEFFSGIGGMRVATEQVVSKKLGLRVSCQAFDISNVANDVYKYNFHPPVERISTSMDHSENNGTTFREQVVTKLVEQLKVTDIQPSDLWTMSPPCQPFTKTRFANQKDLEDKRTAGFQALLKLLGQLPNEQRPRWFFLENVAAFVGSQAHELLRQKLRIAGYEWKEYVTSPTDLGIPNQRTRYYLLAERQAPGAAPLTNRDFANSIDKQAPAKLRVENVQPASLTKFVDVSINQGASTWPMYVIGDDKLSQPWAQELPIVRASQEGAVTYCFTAAYSRQLHKSTGSLLFVPPVNDVIGPEFIQSKNMSKEERINWVNRYSNRVRRFTPRELLALFGFPSSFQWPPDTSLEHQYRLIGNSVSVFVVTRLLEELLATL